MVYDLWWGVIGERALTDAEVGKVAKHVAKWAKEVDGYDLFVAKAAQPEVQAIGSLDLSAEELEDELTLERLFDALGALRKLLRAFELRVEDGFHAFEWDGEGFVSSGKAGGLVHPDTDDAQWEFASRWRPRPTRAAAPASEMESRLKERLERVELEHYRGGFDADELFEAACHPQLIGRVVESWLRAVEGPSKDEWEATRYFSKFASEPAMFDVVLEILRAPVVNVDGYHDKILTSALRMLHHAKPRIDEAAAVVIACLRRDDNARWRDRLVETLMECDTESACAALMLDLAAGARPNATYARGLARHPNAVSLFTRLRDLPFGARDTLDEWRRIEPAGEAERRAMLEHPFWLVRFRAAAVGDYHHRDEDLAAVWRTLKGAETSLRDSDVEDLDNNPANPSSRELLPLPTAVSALASTCTDHRRWAIGYVDERRRESDAPALVLADELDEALAIRGYPRMRPRWTLWCNVVPAVPFDPGERGAWARQQEVDDATLRDVAQLGAEAVAERFPPSHLVLTPEEREWAERLVRTADKLGRKLLRLP